MRKVALFVIAAYAALLAVLTWPLVIVSFAGIKDLVDILCLRDASNRFWEPYASGAYWLFIGVLLLCQAGLLLIPVKVASRRPVSRRSVYWPIAATGFLVGLLALGVIFSAIELFKFQDQPAWALWSECGLCAAIWGAWSIVFCRLSSGREPESVVLQQCKRLLQGSTITLLVAVPCHVVARHRDDCCAGLYTFVGLTFGLSVMLLSFGPGVYFLFAERWKRIHPKPCG